ncbi:MAG: di-trans,poly-cis-decaprenylcistransferase [Pseudomonadales bacterium]|nr:di-trans,poly-cis-decaprenylcistransferase [Pseudomonadales bacterium]
MSELTRSSETSVSSYIVPRHLAIIMDGNNRWAKSRHLPGAAGHRAGAKNVRPVAEACADLGVKYLTLFAFSTENWQRPKPEVELLLGLMTRLLEDDVDELAKRNVRLRVIGDRSRFSGKIQMLMTRAEQLTLKNTRMTLSIAANFGGRWDITNAAKQLALAVQAGELDPEDITDARFQSQLSLGDVPPPDLCIRTGGDNRISNFMLWDMAYTELIFSEIYWPDFSLKTLEDAVSNFSCRERRFGERN